MSDEPKHISCLKGTEEHGHKIADSTAPTLTYTNLRKRQNERKIKFQLPR